MRGLTLRFLPWIVAACAIGMLLSDELLVRALFYAPMIGLLALQRLWTE